MYEKYKQLDGNNEVENSDSSNEESDYEIYSQDEDKQLYNENKRALNKSSKKQIEFDGDCIVLGINSLRKFYYVFNFKWNKQKNVKDFSQIGENFEIKFVEEFSNWMDKLTEGLDLNKKIVQDWPSFS
jgi:hypothetical protein